MNPVVLSEAELAAISAAVACAPALTTDQVVELRRLAQPDAVSAVRPLVLQGADGAYSAPAEGKAA